MKLGNKLGTKHRGENTTLFLRQGNTATWTWACFFLVHATIMNYKTRRLQYFCDWRTSTRNKSDQLGNTSRELTSHQQLEDPRYVTVFANEFKNSQRPSWWSHTGTFHIPSFAHGFPSTLSERVQIVRIAGSRPGWLPSSTRVRRK